jgi:hypothetical protein
VKRETAEGLEQFRRQQEEADKKARRGSDGAQAGDEGSPTLEEEHWVAGGRKRKRAKEKEVLRGVKLRRASTTEQPSEPAAATSKASNSSPSKETLADSTKPAVTVQPPSKSAASVSAEKTPLATPKAGLGLVDYGSDDDD